MADNEKEFSFLEEIARKLNIFVYICKTILLEGRRSQ